MEEVFSVGQQRNGEVIVGKQGRERRRTPKTASTPCKCIWDWIWMMSLVNWNKKTMGEDGKFKEAAILVFGDQAVSV